MAGEGSGVVLSPTGTFRGDLILTGSNPDTFNIQFPEVARGTTLGVVAGAGLGPLSVYAHGSTYQASVDLDYTVSNPQNNPGLPADGTRLEFTEEVKRTQRLAVGAQLDLILLKFGAEYGTGDYSTLSGRATFGFR